jgi:hypothetical protein
MRTINFFSLFQFLVNAGVIKSLKLLPALVHKQEIGKKKVNVNDGSNFIPITDPPFSFVSFF